MNSIMEEENYDEDESVEEEEEEEEEEKSIASTIPVGEAEAELEVERLEEERRREKATMKERLRRVREPHLRRKMVLAEPCIPWEYGSNRHASQKGAGAFGAIRNATLKVHASRALTEGDPNAVPRWSRGGTGHSQAGQTAFGMPREQVTRMIEHEGEAKKRCQELLPDPLQTERILKLWSRPNPPEARNAKLFGARRPEKVQAVGGRAWSKEELASSRAALPRLARVNETSAARDGRDAIRVVASGARQATTHISGLERTEKDQLESNKCMSWLGGQMLMQTQSRTGGFQAPRDVVSTSYYARMMDECTAWKQKKRRTKEGEREEEEEEGDPSDQET